MNVLDASVALKWVLPESDTPKAVRLRNEFRHPILVSITHSRATT